MKNQPSGLVLGVLLFLVPILPVRAAPFTNGSFELGEFPPAAAQAELTNGDTRLASWTIAGSGGPIAWVFGQSPGAGLDFDPLDGTHQLTFNGGNGDPGTTLSQTFDTGVGADYEVSFYVGRLGSGIGTVSLSASVMSGTGQEIATLAANPPTHGYGDRQRLVFRATTATTRLLFTDTSTATISVDVALDNVAVSPLLCSSPNLWPNPHLEIDSNADGIPDFWNKGGSDPSFDIWDTTNYISASHSLMVNDMSTNGYGHWYSDPFPVAAGQHYCLSFYWKYDRPGADGLSVRYYGASNVYLSSILIPALGTQPSWQQVQTTICIADGVESFDLAFGGGFPGTPRMWVDDISLGIIGTNFPPEISLSSPISRASFVARANVIFDAQATNCGRDIQRVEFFQGPTKLGEMTNSPYVFAWTNVAAGNYAVSAVATDNVGQRGTSAPIIITVSEILVDLVRAGAIWKYLDDGSNQGPNWLTNFFDDSGWGSGPAKLGYGDGETTLVGYGADPNNKFITTYFRHSFQVGETSPFGALTLRLVRDDGAVVYLNSQEVFRSNMPTGVVSYLTLASRHAPSAATERAEDTNFVQTSISPNLLRRGTNVIAVEVHNAAMTSSDLGFDLELGVGQLTPQPIIFVNGGYDPAGEYYATNSAHVEIRTTFSSPTILYSLDGSAPSTLYTGPFSRNQSSTIRAIAYNSNFVQSAQSGPVKVTILRAYAVLATSPGGGETTLVPPSGFVSWWHGAGNATDIVGGNNGSLFNAVSFEAGRIGQAFSFDGTNGRIRVEDADSLKLTASLTMEAWLFIKSFPSGSGDNFGSAQILFRGDDRPGRDPYWLALEPDGTIAFQVQSLTDSATIQSPIAINRFVHVAATLDDATGAMRLYLDGARVRQAYTSVRAFRDLDPSSNPGIGIGNYAGPYGNATFHGLIDEVKLYSRALSPAEILAEFLAGGTNYLQNSTVSITAGPSQGWNFLQWFGDATGTDATIALIMNRNKCVEAVFGTPVATSVAGHGSIATSAEGAYYPYGFPLILTAVPQPGNYFAFWANAATGTNNPLTLVVTNPNPTITAVFSTLSGGHFALTVLASGEGRVTVTPFANTYSSGQAVTLTAQPDANQSFTGWSGSATGTQNPLAVTMNQSKVINAHFTARPYLDVLQCLRQLNGDPLQLKLIGTLGEQYRVEGSTNLHDWTVLATLTNLAGTLQFNDQFPTNKTRFYRGVK